MGVSCHQVRDAWAWDFGSRVPENAEEVPAKRGFPLRVAPVRAGAGPPLRRQLGRLTRGWL